MYYHKKNKVSVEWWFYYELYNHYDTLGCGNIKAGGVVVVGHAPYCFVITLLVRVKLGYTPNFTFIGHLEMKTIYMVGLMD